MKRYRWFRNSNFKEMGPGVYSSSARKVARDEWICLFYDALSAHTIIDVIEIFDASKIAVVELPSHTPAIV